MPTTPEDMEQFSEANLLHPLIVRCVCDPLQDEGGKLLKLIDKFIQLLSPHSQTLDPR